MQTVGLYLRHRSRAKVNANCRPVPTPLKTCQGARKLSRLRKPDNGKQTSEACEEASQRRWKEKGIATKNGQRNRNKDINSQESTARTVIPSSNRGPAGRAHLGPSSTPVLTHANTRPPLPPLSPASRRPGKWSTPLSTVNGQQP